MIMKASDIQDLTVACLQQTVTKMMTFEWHKEVAKLSDETMQKKAKLMLMDCQGARLALENAELSNILDKLEQNDAALEKGRDKLKKALENFKKVKIVLDAVNSLLSIVSKIVAL
jgi:predicted nucleic acid-binding protein